jgi:hypothetical protein
MFHSNDHPHHFKRRTDLTSNWIDDSAEKRRKQRILAIKHSLSSKGAQHRGPAAAPIVLDAAASAIVPLISAPSF